MRNGVRSSTAVPYRAGHLPEIDHRLVLVIGLVADPENGGDGVEQAAQGNADRQRAGEETEAGSLDDAPTRTAALPVSASGREGVTRLRSGSP